MNRKQWMMLFGTMLAFLAVAMCVVIVFNCHVQTIYLGLKKSVTLMNVRAMIGVLLVKLLGATILGVSGAYCIYLYYQTFGNSRYITLASAFFFGAGIIMTLMNYKVLFYATAVNRRIWQLGGDIFLVVLSALVFRILFLGHMEKPDRRVDTAYWLAHLFTVCAMLFSSPTQSWHVLRWYGWASWIMSGLMMVRLFRKGISLWGGVRLLMMLLLSLFIMLVGSYKLNTEEDLYTTYLELTPYFVVIYMQLVLAMIFRFQRKDMLLGRTELRRLQEVQLYEQMLIRNTMVHSYRTLDEFSRRSQEIANNAGENRGKIMELSQGLESAARGISASMPYTRLQDISLKLDLSQTSLDIVFYNMQLELLQNSAFQGTNLHLTCPPHCYAACDPNLLIRACHTLVLTMADISGSGHINLEAMPRDEDIEIRMRTDIRETQRRTMRRMIRTLHRREMDYQNVIDEDLSLMIAKAILSAHGARVATMCTKNQLLISWHLPYWRESPDAADSPVAFEVAEKGHSIRVTLVSTSSSQISFVRSSLNSSFYSLHVFKGVETLLDFLKSTHVNVIIVGTLSINVTSIEVCRAVRKSYSLGLMPILLIQPSDALSLESSFMQLANDILLEPFSHAELNRRILSLSMLQRSTEELRRSRLEFLQSQMNPHFIFNAISTIMPLCISDPRKAYALLGSFSEYLRGNLFPKQQNKPILVHEEIDLVRAYLTLENVRLENRIIFNITEEYDDRSIIFPLLIEPIVENCVKHGLHDKRSPSTTLLHIDISVVQRGDILDLMIRDDGIGFDVSCIEDRQHKPSEGHRSIGLGNLNARLNLYYNTSLNIQSAKGEGTSVSFSIPNHNDMPLHEDVLEG